MDVFDVDLPRGTRDSSRRQYLQKLDMSFVTSTEINTNSSATGTAISVTLSTTPLLMVLQAFLKALSGSGSQSLAVNIDASASLLPENVTVLAVLKLLRNDFRKHRVNSIAVHTRLRSTLVSVDAFIHGEHVVGLGRLDLRYDVDDLMTVVST